jgi:hypothetical protein
MILRRITKQQICILSNSQFLSDVTGISHLFLQTSHRWAKFSNSNEFISILKAESSHKHETTQVSVYASTDKNIHLLYLPFVTISIYLGDALPLAPEARPVGRRSRPPTNRDMRHLSGHLYPTSLISKRIKVSMGSPCCLCIPLP